jgi:hypothetical protein
MVEFLASAVFLVVTIAWTVQLIVMIYTWVVMAAAAKEGVRYAVVHGSKNDSGSQAGPSSGSAFCATSGVEVAAVITAVRRAANYPGMTVTVCYPDGNNKPASRVTVNASYPFATLFTLGFTPPTIRSSAQGRIVF